MKQILLPVFLLVTMTVFGRQPGPSETDFLEKQKTPLAFIENKGQVTDQNRKARPDIDYKLAAGGLTLFIGDGQLHYEWYRADPDATNFGNEPKEWDKAAKHKKITIYRMDVSLVDANKNAKVITEGKQDYYEQYYTPGCENGVMAHTYKKITYKEVYPNIDWVLYTENDQLKYDFVIYPGGNPRNIKLKYDGATELVTADGGFTATTPMGSITEPAPYSYTTEDKQQVNSDFKLDGNVLSFDIGAYNGTLVIDPQVKWATYYGQSGIIEGFATVADNAGNVYLAGDALNSPNLATAGAHQANVAGDIDAYLVKFNSLGNRLWATYYGGTLSDIFFDLACDASDNIYGGGLTSSHTGIASTGSFQPNHGGGWQDGFIVKFNSNGLRQWATYYGDIDDEGVTDIATDLYGNVYATGSVENSTLLSTPGAHQTVQAGSTDAYLVKFNSSGARLWATYYGGIDFEDGSGVTCDNLGNVYLHGHTHSLAGIATPGSYQPAFAGGGGDAYLVKFNPNGVRQWGTYYGGSGGEGFYTGWGGGEMELLTTRLGTFIYQGKQIASPASQHPERIKLYLEVVYLIYIWPNLIYWEHFNGLPITVALITMCMEVLPYHQQERSSWRGAR